MKIYLTLFLIYFTTSLFSQIVSCDKIVCINGEEIEAIISEITPDIISYKKCDNADGPKYSIERTKVFVIKYKNGTKEVINDLNNPIAKTPKPKKVNKPHNKFYKGVELHCDEMYNRNSVSNIGKSSYNLYASFLMNYKLNDLIEFDGSIGGGIGGFYYKLYAPNPIILTYAYGVNNNNGFLGIGNLGVRVNFLNFFEVKNRFLNPFIKPEISIVTAPEKPILSYSIMTGMNINKFFTISIGYKYTSMKAVTNLYNYTDNSKSISNSKISFHNILGKISFEF
jgi:hypothetical protein